MSTSQPNLKAVFSKAMDFTDPAARASYLAEACGGNANLRGEVESLIQALDQAGSFLEAAASPVAQTINQPAIQERPGTQIGPYKLLQQIGEGGMGTVFMAEQCHPVQRKVALKVIKA